METKSKSIGTFLSPDDPWSPTLCFEEGSVTFQHGGTFTFGPNGNVPRIQCDFGSSAGFSCDTILFDKLLGESTSWCWSDYDYDTNRGESRAALIEIKLPSLGLSTYSFAVEVPGLTQPTLGRFMVTDLLTILHRGHCASPIKLPVDDNGRLTMDGQAVPLSDGLYSLTPPPDFPTARSKLIQSPIGQHLHTAMRDEYGQGVKLKKEGQTDLALIHFQRVSVYGYFIFQSDEMANAHRAVAACHRDRGEYGVALSWAKRSRELQANESIAVMIESIEEKIKK
ncbi:hypothetical protein PROFUN_07248 [Planoprotostelium fungivorum]|uniref:Uncharacterized protein n=1 Tax=Planoprotostelium fungivorum TaxID=1890364 RepID=A0A2P6NM74_9EUKA|nr:hypothetical protein PROFUN_07248 [Planoprotostelium fungivorum]